MRLVAVASLPLLASVCLSGCAPADPSAESQAAITNGSSDSGDKAVVLVHGSVPNTTNYTTCTGTFLTSRDVLTAAHCFLDKTLKFSIGVNELYDFSGFDSTQPGLYAIDSYVVDPAYNPSAILPAPHDLAMIHLSSDVGTSTLPFHAGALDASFVGQPVHLVGYGRTSPNTISEGTRRSVDTVVGAVASTFVTITSGKQACGGDSGGPALMTINGVQTIVGVAESAAADCKTDAYYDTIDGDIEFINDQLATSGSSGASTSGGTTGGAQTGGGCSATGQSATSLYGALALLVLFFRRRRTA